MYFLGPNGSHTHQTALSLSPSAELIPIESITQVFEKCVETGELGIVPLENSTFGKVIETAVALKKYPEILIINQITVAIHHSFLINKCIGATQELKRVYSHQQAFGQCKEWMISYIKPNVQLIECKSTSYAAECASRDVSGAAICNIICKDIYGLQLLQENIETMENNCTRFITIGYPKE